MSCCDAFLEVAQCHEYLWYLGEWWLCMDAEWTCPHRTYVGGHVELGPAWLKCRFVNLLGHYKTFEFHYAICLERFCKEGRKGFRIMPKHEHSPAPQKTFWMVMKRGSPGTCVEKLSSEEYKSEERAIQAAEEAAQRCGGDAEFFVMQAVYRTKISKVTTERLCGC